METKELIKRASSAKQQVLDGALKLWNTRLEGLAEAGDIRSVLDHLRAPLEGNIDNCGCNVQCAARPDSIVSRTPPEISK